MAYLKVNGLHDEAHYLLIGNTIEYKRYMGLMKYYADKLDHTPKGAPARIDLEHQHSKAKSRAERHLNAIKLIAAIDDHEIKRVKDENHLINMFKEEDLKISMNELKKKAPDDLLFFGPMILDLDKEKGHLQRNYENLLSDVKYIKSRLIDGIKQD